MPHETKLLSAEQFLLTTLVVKLAVMAALATMLVRYPRFRHILIFEKRDWPDRLIFAASLGIPLTAGVVARLLLNYNAADLTLEGVVSRRPDRRALRRRHRRRDGRPAGRLSTARWIALPFAVGCGFAGGGLRELCPKEAIWHFSPFVFTDLHRKVWRLVQPVPDRLDRHPAGRADRARAAAPGLGARFGPPASQRDAPVLPRAADRVACTRSSSSRPCCAWPSRSRSGTTRASSTGCRSRRSCCWRRAIEALASQINPHFLFNTLTSISSLIRSQPETARMLIIKLSGLLRRLLRSQEHFVTLREELEAIDEYLDIEAVRFGPQAADREVDRRRTASMSSSRACCCSRWSRTRSSTACRPKVGEGRITIRSVLQNGHAIIEVIDDGVGVNPANADRVKIGAGIGLRNVNERLKVIYGANYQLQLDSVPGEGTCARIVIPELLVPARITA